MKPGDVVVLISGGEPMTVMELEDASVRCQWFEKKGGWNSGLFLLSSLKRYEDSAIDGVELGISFNPPVI